MKTLLMLCFSLFILPAIWIGAGTSNVPPTPSQDYSYDYIEAWKKFYPSKAVAQGMHASIFHYEDRALTTIQTWVDLNKTFLRELSDPNNAYAKSEAINTRLLRNQIKEELHIWEDAKEHQNKLTLYSSLIDRAMDKVFEADYLTQGEKADLICQRTTAVLHLIEAALQSLKQGQKDDLKRGIKQLTNALNFHQKELPEKTKEWKSWTTCENQITQKAIAKIKVLIKVVEQKLLPHAKEGKPILGKAEYTRRLALYTDSDLTPDRLSQMALEEIEKVRQLIGEVSKNYLKQHYPNEVLPSSMDAIIKRAFGDMEKDAPKDGADYLQFWQELSASAIKFIEEKEIATLPEFQTLRIMTAPESAGAAARIGWVDSAPPFAPNPVTTLYLPSIPDTFPEAEKKDFWSSFNKPFNRMIVIHELVPGHYMQIKISRETAHPVRLLFPYALYFEGWATFTERVCLDEGWEKDNPLTFLAHLRKRIENANRAYTSVQVHCNEWTQDQVMQFSTETSLLAPQFAKSLWGRIMRSPMQLTSYFLGGQQFTELFKAEQERLGTDFNLKHFMDTIMKVGPVPIDEFEEIFKNEN